MIGCFHILPLLLVRLQLLLDSGTHLFYNEIPDFVARVELFNVS